MFVFEREIERKKSAFVSRILAKNLINCVWGKRQLLGFHIATIVSNNISNELVLLIIVIACVILVKKSR